jgi:chromosome segregation ATPase
MAALVQALYRENQHFADDAASAHQAYQTAHDQADAAEAEIAKLQPVLKQEEESAAQLESAEAALKQAQDKSGAYWRAWEDATKARHDAEAEVDRLDVTGSGAATASTGPAAMASVDSDPQIKDLSTQLAAANESLSESRSEHSAAADAANKALDEALGQFKTRIDQAQGSLQDGSQLKAYLIAAQQAQDTIRQLNADLVERQKAEQQRLAELSRALSEKQEARLKAAWAADTQLQGMDQDLSVAEHRYNAAVGSGLDSDAAQLKTEVDTLKQQIDARRDLIGTGDIYADEVKSLQQFIDDSLKGMESDRVRADARMGEMLKALADAAPQIQKLPADQQALAESLEQQLDGINNARKAQAAAVAAANPDADASVKQLQGTITELQAKLDARRKQLVEDSQQQLTSQQTVDRVAALDKAKATLAAAQLVEADASTSVRANKQQTDADYSLVEGLKAKASNLTSDTARMLQLQSSLPQMKSDADRLLAAWQRIPVPEAPKPENASATVVNDPRLQWILLSSLGYALLMVALLAVSGVSYHRHHLLTSQSNQSDEEEADEFPTSEFADVLESRGAAPTHGGEPSEAND